MHLFKTLSLCAITLSTTATALPIQSSPSAVANPNNPIDNILTNVKGGIQGFTDFLGGEKEKRQAVGDPNNPVDDLLTNVKGGLQGFTDFVGGDRARRVVRRRAVKEDSVGDVLTDVEGGFEGFGTFVTGESD